MRALRRQHWFFKIAGSLGLSAGFLALPAGAQDKPPPIVGTNSLVNIVGNTAGYTTEFQNENFFVEILGNVVFTFLSMLGLIFTALLILGGYKWMMARGNESKIDEAKGTIRHALTGLAIMLAAYGVWLAVAAIL